MSTVHEEFPAITPARQSGEEQFCEGSEKLPFNLQDFWAWSASHLMDNTMRGILAEYIVARGLGIVEGLRIEWEPFDLVTPDGIKVEVKSSAYLQSWGQKKLTSITFAVPPTFGWDGTSGAYGTVRQRQADVYVFALLTHRDKTTVNPLNLAQWAFYVVPTAVLDRELAERKTVSLLQLQRLATSATTFSGLLVGVEAAAVMNRQLRAVIESSVPTT
jgi:hypothetical protein